MGNWLKQNTGTTLQMGPVLLSSDGVTPSTGQSPTVYLSKANGTFAARGSTSAITADRDGWYRVPVSSDDTATLGRLVAQFTNSTHLPVWHDFLVVPANAYDSLVSGTDTLDAAVVEWAGTTVSTSMTAPTTAPTNFALLSISTAGRTSANVTQIDGSSAAADTLQRAVDAYEQGTVAGSSAASLTFATGASTEDDYYNGSFVWVVGNTGAEQVRKIVDYTGATLVAAVEPNWVTNPTTSSTYIVLPVAPAPDTTLEKVEVSKWAGSTVSTAMAAVSTAGFPSNFSVLSISTGGVADARVTLWSTNNTAASTSQIAVLTSLAKTTHVTGFNDVSAADVNAQVSTAIETYHLDHLLAVAYDPATPPGAADALLNELVEATSGVARFTATALELAPAGTGTSLTAADVADAVWDEARSGHVSAGSFGEALDTTVSSRASSTELPTNLALLSISTGGVVDADAVRWASQATTSGNLALSTASAPSNWSLTSISTAGVIDARVTLWSTNNTAASTSQIAILTALAKGTQITGLNDLSTTQVATVVNASTAVTSRAASTELPTNFASFAISTGGIADARVRTWSTASAAVSTSDIAIKTALAKGTEITGFNDLSSTAINDQVVDVLTVDTFTELTSAPPSSAPTFRQMVQWPYQFSRNQIVTDPSTQVVYDSTGGVVGTAAITEASSVLTRGKFS